MAKFINRATTMFLALVLSVTTCTACLMGQSASAATTINPGTVKITDISYDLSGVVQFKWKDTYNTHRYNIKVEQKSKKNGSWKNILDKTALFTKNEYVQSSVNLTKNDYRFTVKPITDSATKSATKTLVGVKNIANVKCYEQRITAKKTQALIQWKNNLKSKYNPQKYPYYITVVNIDKNGKRTYAAKNVKVQTEKYKVWLNNKTTYKVCIRQVINDNSKTVNLGFYEGKIKSNSLAQLKVGERIRMNANDIAKEIVKIKKLSHDNNSSSKCRTLEDAKKNKSVNANAYVSIVLQESGVLKPGETIGYIRSGKSKNSVKTSLKNANLVNNNKVKATFVNAKFDNLNKKYKVPGTVYIWDCNAGIYVGGNKKECIYNFSLGNGVSSAAYRYKYNSYNFNHKILVAITPRN